MDWNANAGMADSVLEAVGRTPLIRLGKIAADVNADLRINYRLCREAVYYVLACKRRIACTLSAHPHAKYVPLIEYAGVL